MGRDGDSVGYEKELWDSADWEEELEDSKGWDAAAGVGGEIRGNIVGCRQGDEEVEGDTRSTCE